MTAGPPAAPEGLPEAARKELFSIAYVTAIAAAAQCELLVPRMDYASIDGQILATYGVQPQIGVQLKATEKDCLEDDYVVFDLPVKNYNHLRSPKTVPAMLVVVHLPANEDQWMTHDIDLLQLRNNAYYFNLLGFGETTNTHTVRIRIPREQRLTRESLKALLEHVAMHRSLPA